MIVFTLWSFSAAGSTPGRPAPTHVAGNGRLWARYHPRARFRHWLTTLGVSLLMPLTGTAAPVLSPPVPATSRHESLGLPVIEPMLLLEAFSQLSPIIGGPIAFDLRRKHAELGVRQVAEGSDVTSVAERLDSAGLGLADLTAIECRGPRALVRFDVDTRRIELEGSETIIAWTLPVIDRLLATSPLSVQLQCKGDQSTVTVTNHGAEAWLITEVRIAEGKTQRLSSPIAGKLQSDGDGWKILPKNLQVSLETEYQGLVPPGMTRRFPLATGMPAGGNCGVSLVAYRLTEPMVLGGLFLKRTGDKNFQPAAPPWEQWQVAPLLMLGAWPPALIVVRQVQTERLFLQGP